MYSMANIAICVLQCTVLQAECWVLVNCFTSWAAVCSLHSALRCSNMLQAEKCTYTTLQSEYCTALYCTVCCKLSIFHAWPCPLSLCPQPQPQHHHHQHQHHQHHHYEPNHHNYPQKMFNKFPVLAVDCIIECKINGRKIALVHRYFWWELSLKNWPRYRYFLLFNCIILSLSWINLNLNVETCPERRRADVYWSSLQRYWMLVMNQLGLIIHLSVVKYWHFLYLFNINIITSFSHYSSDKAIWHTDTWNGCANNNDDDGDDDHHHDHQPIWFKKIKSCDLWNSTLHFWK